MTVTRDAGMSHVGAGPGKAHEGGACNASGEAGMAGPRGRRRHSDEFGMIYREAFAKDFLSNIGGRAEGRTARLFDRIRS
jgi:hypothetical protein